jgi:hypothetical protein
MNNYFPLLGVAVCLGIASLPAIFNLFGGAQDGHVFKYSRGFRVFLWTGSLCLLLSGVAFKIFGSDAGPSSMQLALLILIGLTAVIGCIYTDKYHIALNANDIEFGAFRSTSVRYKDITTLRRVPGRTPILEVHTLGRAYSLSGNVQGFAKLCELLEKNTGRKFT